MTNFRQDQAAREARARETPFLKNLPDGLGIRAVAAIDPKFGRIILDLADLLLVDDFPGATISRGERELIATGVSAGNGCFFCTDTHFAFASAQLRNEGVDEPEKKLVGVKACDFSAVSPKLRALMQIAEFVRSDARDERIPEAAEAAKIAGASEADIELAILIASSFKMFNSLVDGFRTQTPADPFASYHLERAEQIVRHGYRPAGG